MEISGPVQVCTAIVLPLPYVFYIGIEVDELTKHAGVKRFEFSHCIYIL